MPLPTERDAGLSFHVARGLAALSTAYHRAELQGAEQLPDGPALIVSNHGLFGLDTPIFFYLLHRDTGRVPVGLAERLFCKLQPMQRVLEEIGGVEGTYENALRLLAEGRLVVCYPGGAREVFKEPSRLRHRLVWERSLGVLRVARDAGVPIVPAAGAGIDDTWRVLAHLRPPGLEEKYRLPVAVGPLPVRMRFRIGRPLPPPPPDADEARMRACRSALQAEIEQMLEELEDAR